MNQGNENDDSMPSIPGSPVSTPVTTPARAAAGCPSCGRAPESDVSTARAATPPYVYAVGRIEPRFPRLSVEKELAQVAGKSSTPGLTDRQMMQKVLSDRQNRYLVRQLCWVLTIAGMEVYILVPRDPGDAELLVDSLRPTPSPMDLDVVVGVREGLAPPQFCNGLLVPVVAFDQIYSFDRASLVQSIPRDEKTPAEAFEAAAQELLDRILQITDNSGAADEHRALNYLAVRYPALYTAAAAAFERNASLTSVTVRPSALSGIRKIVEVIFSYTHRITDVVEKVFVRVDVTEEFPFLVTKLSPYYDR
jgi:hypothetical protein